MNLAVNARDAMPGGGALTLTTAVTPLPADLRGGNAAAAADRYVALSVKDTGCGIPADVRDRMFEPFFTTKAPGKGTGLGLSTVYGIVTQSGGQVTVESEVGAGTTFTIYFPAVEDAGEPTLVEPLVARGLSGTETILLVEDDPAIRGLAQRILERCGYTVLTAHDGASGEQAAIQHTGAIDLLVTDIRMPDMSGPNLAQRIVMRRSEAKVLYMSGYAEDPARIIAQHSRMGILNKPFSPEQLAARVRECLDTPA
jgi:CheY-like chemotaxis protein